ncbi:hypothetical protein Bca4012_025545 [Brassica carinata]
MLIAGYREMERQRRRRRREEEELLRQVPSSAVNREDVTAKSDVGSVEECSKLEFTKDEVFALLSERAKAGKFDTKGKIEQMTDIIKRLKVWTNASRSWIYSSSVDFPSIHHKKQEDIHCVDMVQGSRLLSCFSSHNISVVAGIISL